MKLTCKLKGVDWQKFPEGMDAAFSSFDESDSLKTDVNCFYEETSAHPKKLLLPFLSGEK